MNEGLTDENYEALSRYRQERAHETLGEITYLRDQGYYNTAVNRLYYACYYAAVALLTNHQVKTSPKPLASGMFVDESFYWNVWFRRRCSASCSYLVPGRP